MKIGYYPGRHIKNNVSFFLQEHAIKQANKVVFFFLQKDALDSGSFDHSFITYKNFNNIVNHFSGGLLRAGIKKGDRVIVFTSISPELYISIAGLQRIGAIPVLIDSWSRKEQLVEIFQNSQPSAIIALNGWLKTFIDYVDVFGIKIKISVNDDTTAGKDVIQLNDLLKGAAGKIVPVKQDDIALITYTTGSSGIPKGASRTHRFLAAQHYTLKRLFPYKSKDIDIPVFPVFALNNIASGITTVIPAIDISKPNIKDSKILISQIKSCKVNCMTLAPSSFRNLAIYCNMEHISLDGISRILTGGAPISETDILGFIKIAPNSKNWILYGSTEVEPIAYIESREMLSIKKPKWKNTTKIGVNVGMIDDELHSKCIDIKTGTICQDIEVESIEIKNGEVGELIVAGEHVCEGYYKNEEAFLRAKIKDRHGIVWHRTGDLARIDKDGYVWIVGRKHNVIKRGTEYFFPVRPEIILKDLSNVSNAAYLSFASNKKDRIIAVVTLKEADKKKEKMCRNEICKVFKKENLPLDEVVFIEEIPMDVRHHSKVDYDKLQKKLYEIFA